MDEGYISRLGIDPKRIYIFSPPSGEAACEYAEKFSQVPEVRAIIVDSLAALVPVREIDADSYLDGQARGARAQLIARMCRALIVHINSEVPRLAIMLNHLLPLVNGQGEYIPGGREQEYLSSVVVKFWAGGKSKSRSSDDKELEGGEEVRKQDVGFLIKNSKVSRDNVSGEFAIFTQGDKDNLISYGDTDDWQSVTDWAIKLNLLETRGSRIVVNDKEYGPRQIVEYWRTNVEEYVALQREVIERTKPKA